MRVKFIPAYSLSSADLEWQILRAASCGEDTAMAQNSVQFQKGLSEAEFEERYGTEEKCRAVVMNSRWPNGFECPVCGGRTYSEVTTRRLFQCSTCRRQTSLTAGTIFASTHVPLRLWFRAMYHLTQSKQGISSIELGRRLGVKQTTAWKMKPKLAQVMMERDASKHLTGRVEVDDAYLGGERTGGKRGRGAPGKTPFVAAVETTPEGKPVRLKLRRVTSFCNRAISGFAKRGLDPNCEVVSDGLACFNAMSDVGCTHQVVKTGSGPTARVQVGQHRARQHQGGHRRDLPSHPREARATLPRGVRIPLQQALRSRGHVAAPDLGSRAHPAHALSVAQAWRGLCVSGMDLGSQESG